MRAMKTFPGILLATATFAAAESLLYLPITGDLEKSGDAATVNRLYHDVVESQFKGTLLSITTGAQPCGTRDCALKAANSSNADAVIYSTFSRLGSKWVFNSTLVKSDGSDAFNQRLTALSIEDMEAVTQRMAEALLNRKTTEQVANVDNLTEKEETTVPVRRRSLSSSGVAVGYLYPTDKKAFNNNPAVIRLAFENNWEMRDNMMLNGELVWGAFDVSIGADINLNYLFSRSDYSPFLGGGLGLHIINSDLNTSDQGYSGPALNVQGGMLFFRTYDIHLMLRGQYQVVFNDDMAQSFGFNAAVTFRKLSF